MYYELTGQTIFKSADSQQCMITAWLIKEGEDKVLPWIDHMVTSWYWTEEINIMQYYFTHALKDSSAYIMLTYKVQTHNSLLNQFQFRLIHFNQDSVRSWSSGRLGCWCTPKDLSITYLVLWYNLVTFFLNFSFLNRYRDINWRIFWNFIKQSSSPNYYHVCCWSPSHTCAWTCHRWRC